MACQGQAQVCSNLCPQGIVTELSEPQSHSLTSGVQSSSELKDLTDTSLITQDTATVSESTTEKHMHESLSKRYCSGQIGVPITVLDKYNPEQLEIVKFRKGDDEKDLTYSVDVKCLSKQASRRLHLTSESLSARYCNGIIGVPITFLDKWSPEQFRIIDINPHFFAAIARGEEKPKQLQLRNVGEKDPYARILISKIL